MKWFEKNIASLFTKKEEAKQQQNDIQSESTEQSHVNNNDPILTQLTKCVQKKKKLKSLIKTLYLSKINPSEQELYQSLYYKQNISVSKQLRNFFNSAEIKPDIAKPDVYEELKNIYLQKQFSQQQQQMLLEDTVPPILVIAIVEFHHTKGPVLDYIYPLDINKIFYSDQDLEYVKDKITQYSMPDAVHNKNEDFIYFMIKTRLKQQTNQAQQQIIFGTSYFKQIATTQEMRQIDPDITRSYIQKSICILSKYPLFGYLQLKLYPTISAYFSQKNLKDYSILQSSFENTNKSISDTKQNIEESEIYTGLQPKILLEYFQDKVLMLLKAVILEKKIVIFSQQSQTCTNFILSLLSLLPCQMHFQFSNHKIGKLESMYRDYGFPLQVYNEIDRSLWLYFNISDLDMLKGMKSYIIGTTNVMIKQHKLLQADIIVDLQSNTFTYKDEQLTKLLSLNKHEKKFIQSLFQTCGLQKLQLPKGQALQFNDAQNENTSWVGSNDQIRTLFYKYFKKMMTEFALLLFNYNNVIENIHKKVQEDQQFLQEGSDENEEGDLSYNNMAKDLSEAQNQTQLNGQDQYNKVVTYEMQQQQQQQQQKLQHDSDKEAKSGNHTQDTATTIQSKQEKDLKEKDQGKGKGKEEGEGKGENQQNKEKSRKDSKDSKERDGKAKKELEEEKEKKKKVKEEKKSKENEKDKKDSVLQTKTKDSQEEGGQNKGQSKLSKKKFRKQQKTMLRQNYHELKQHNMQFFIQWVTTQNFKMWNHVRDDYLYLRSSSFNEQVRNIYILQDSGELYIGDLKDGEKNGIGTIIDFANNLISSGKFIFNQRFGKFQVQSIDDSYQFVGFFEQDLKNGEGNLVNYVKDNYFQYIGHFKNDLFEGQGTLIYPNNFTYDGEFHLGKKHGMGKLKMQNGDYYVGQFVEEQKHGKGQFITNDGKNIYNGYFRNNMKSGEGELQLENEKYEGEFENDVFHGQGRFMHSNGNVYIGQFINGKLIVDDQVEIKYPNGDLYGGLVVNWMPSGYGIMQRSNGELQEGIFENGELVQMIPNDSPNKTGKKEDEQKGDASSPQQENVQKKEENKQEVQNEEKAKTNNLTVSQELKSNASIKDSPQNFGSLTDNKLEEISFENDGKDNKQENKDEKKEQ